MAGFGLRLIRRGPKETLARGAHLVKLLQNEQRPFGVRLDRRPFQDFGETGNSLSSCERVCRWEPLLHLSPSAPPPPTTTTTRTRDERCDPLEKDATNYPAVEEYEDQVRRLFEEESAEG